MADSAVQSILTAQFSQPQFLAKNENTGGDAIAVIWKGMAVVEVDLSPSAAVTDHPLVNSEPKDSATTEKIENTELQSLKIIQPTRMQVSAIIGDLSTLESLISTFNDSKVTISIDTKSLITKNLVMTDLQITQDGDMLTASRVKMTFEQAVPPSDSGYAPEQSGDSSTYGFGIQEPKSIVDGFGSLQNSITTALGRVPVTIFGPLLNNKGGPFILDHLKNGMLA